MKLEEAIRRAKASAWPWKLEEEVVKATIVLGKWQSLRRVEDAIASRSKRNIKLAIEEAEAKFTAEEDKIDLRRAKIALEELEAEDALEGGDKRLKAYFMASKVAWQSGSVTPNPHKCSRRTRVLKSPRWSTNKYKEWRMQVPR